MASFGKAEPGSADVGVIGLAVMGQNLALNIADHGFMTAVYNRTVAKTEAFVDENPPEVFGGGGGGLVPSAELGEFVASLARPRRVVVMVQAGRATDAVIDSLVPLLDAGDVIVDGGNALYTDTDRREAALTEKGIHFVGSGVSGGELGARFGPSLMPGGKREAWEILEPVWSAIAAKVDPETGKELTGAAPGKPITGGEACSAFIGPGGSGHYVKMVHNGIEYSDMQLICEAWHLMSTLGHLEPAECADVFAKWNEGDLDSFLIEITSDILRQNDPVTGGAFVDIVLDRAGQKGTGRWTSSEALELGIPATGITEAVFARCLSAIKDEREKASTILTGPEGPAAGKRDQRLFTSHDALIDSIGQALYCAKICSYAQGFQLMRAASSERDWNLDFASIARIWRGGCIIRARFLQRITDAYERDPGLVNLLLDPYFARVLEDGESAWRRIVANAAIAGIPVPCLGATLSWFDGYRTARLPASLLQAQRDYFGAHSYERTDQPRGEHFHLDWPHPERPQAKV